MTAADPDQFAANIVDYRDSDNDPTIQGSKYGFEPHPYITEVYYNISLQQTKKWTWEYRIELYNPFNSDIQLDANWRLRYTNNWYKGDGSDWPQSGAYFTLSSYTIAAGQYATLGCNSTWDWEPATPTLTQVKADADVLVAGMKIYGYDEDNNEGDPATPQDLTIELLRNVGGAELVMDIAKPSSSSGGFAAQPSVNQGISRERKFYQSEQTSDWSDCTYGALPKHTLKIGGFAPPDPGVAIKQMYIANERIYSLGELGEIALFGFVPSSGDTSTDYGNSPCYVYTRDPTYISNPDNVKFDLFSEDGRQLFDKFLTYDPGDSSYNIYDDDGDGRPAFDESIDPGGDGTPVDVGTASNDIGGPEIQVPGRININTAPKRVLKCLPRPKDNNPFDSECISDALVDAIIQYRTQNGPFRTIGDILNVSQMQELAFDGKDNDMDGLKEEKDEKDLLIKSIANLITVRTNVFAVYCVGRVLDRTQSQVLGRRRLVAVVDRSVTPIAIRYFRWMGD